MNTTPDKIITAIIAIIIGLIYYDQYISKNKTKKPKRKLPKKKYKTQHKSIVSKMKYEDFYDASWEEVNK